MATREDNLLRMVNGGIVAVVRAPGSDDLISVVKALREGGIECIEITMTTPNALDVIREAAKALAKEALIGVGTVLDPETARMAILAGAEYVVTPTLNIETIRMCKRYSKVVVAGAFTPTEILTAWEAGADVVKVFPATAVGPAYFKDVKGPLPHIRLAPTGGVSLENVGDFLKAGADFVAVGGNLVKNDAIKNKRFSEITELAKQYAAAVKAARKKD